MKKRILIAMIIDPQDRDNLSVHGPGFHERRNNSTEVMADMVIDVDRLRRDMLDNCYALCFAADIAAALAEIPEIERASDEELIEMARQQGIDLSRYEV